MSVINRPKKTVLLLAASAIAAVQLGLVSAPSAAHAEQPVVSTWQPAAEITSPVLKPAWTLNVDAGDNWSDSGRSASADGKIFAFAGGRLIGVDAQTGKRLWSYGQTKLKPYVVAKGGKVYGSTADGRIYALSAAGNRLWTTAALGNPDAIVPTGNRIYVVRGLVTYAVDAATGKVLWKAVEKEGETSLGEVMEADGVVYRTFLRQGALTSIHLSAYDSATGKHLWGAFRQNMPLKAENGLVYSLQLSNVILVDGPDRSLNVSVMNARTGALKGTRSYAYRVQAGPNGEMSVSDAAFLDGNRLYVYQFRAVAAYDFSAYSANQQPLRKWGISDEWSLFNKVHNGRILFWDYNQRQLAGVKTANGQIVSWTGDNPAVRVDVFGNGVYIGQSDGMFHGIDYATGKPAFRVPTAGRAFGPTLKEGGTIVVQTEGKLTAVRIPASLK